MATIQTIQSTDLISDSRADLNTNFENLNSDKIETSTLDTDTSLAANSDSKIATQKAVKAYVDSGGQQNASETVRGLVEEATDAEVTAGTATGGTGAKLFITPAKFATYIATFITTYITPISGGLTKFIGVGSTSNTSYRNFKYLFAWATGNGWANFGTATYRGEFATLAAAGGIYKALWDIVTGANQKFDNTKKKILEFDAKIQADATGGFSLLGFFLSTVTSAAGVDASISNNRDGVCFATNTSGAWYAYAGNATNSTQTLISTPSAGVHTFRIEWNPATPNALYYIDGTLVATITTYLPTDTSEIIILFGNGSTGSIIQELSAPNYAEEK